MQLENYLLEKAYQYLARRDHSCRELRQKLSKALKRHKHWQHADREEAEAAMNSTLDELMERGYLDDARFALNFVQNRIDHKPRSPYFIRQELREKGVEDSIIEQVCMELDLDSLATEMARRLAAKKEPGLAHLPADKRREKLIRFLKGKGFVYGDIMDALG